MKTLHKMKIRKELKSQITAQFQPPPLWMEERIREALTEPAKPITPAQFKGKMKAIAAGR